MNGIVFQQALGTSRGLHFSLSRLALSCSGLGSGSWPPGHASCLPSAAPPLLATGLFGDLCPISKAPRRGRQSQLQAGGSNAHRIPQQTKTSPRPPPRNLGALGQLLKHKAGSSCQHPAGNTPQQQQTCPCCCSGDGYSRFDSCSCPRRMPEATLRGKHCRKEGGREAEGGPVPKHHAAGPRVAADRPQEVGLNPLPKPRDSRHKLLSRRLFMKSQSRRAGPQHMQSIKMFTTAQGGGIRKAPALETSSSDESCSSEPKSCPHKSARPAESSSHGKPPPAVPGQGSAASMGAKGEEPSATRHSRGALPAPVSSPGNFPAAFGLAG